MMRNEHHRTANLRLQFFEKLDGRNLESGVECGCRLVGDQQRRLHHQRHGDGDPLLHAAGKFVRVAGERVRRIRNTHTGQHLGRPPVLVAVRQLGTVLDVAHLPANGEDRVQRTHRVLKDSGDARAAQCLHFARLQAGEVPALKGD